MSKTINPKSTSKKSVRELRVFLSSTFRDMMQERDYLIKQIFPQISNIANERGISFTAIDLRWGVTEEEANQGQVVRICLEEIDRCRPFFIGFIGERYGWVPQRQDIGHYQELLSYFPVVEPNLKQGKSLTELEILYGVLESETFERGAFYFRDLAFTEALANEGHQFDYFEQTNEQNEKLIQLKDRIIKSAYPIRHYGDLEKLGQQIKEDLIATLEALFPPQKIEKEIDRQRFIHRNYAENRAFRYLAKQDNLDVLDQFLGQSDKREQFSTLVLMGASGIGKSALLCHWMNQLKRCDPERLTIEHYVGASGNRSAHHLLSRLILEIRAIVKQINNRQYDQNRMQDDLFDEIDAQSKAQLPEDLIELKKLLTQEILLIPQNQSLLIVIDAINQIDEPILKWFPKIVAPNISLILSSTSHDKNDSQEDFKWDQIFATGFLKQFEIQPLDLDDRKALIEHYLIHYRKKLSVSQMDKIARNHKSENPLFLVSVLAELQIFGSFEQLDALIDGYMNCDDLEGLFEKIIIRLENDYGNAIIQKVLSKIWASRYGLSEDELVKFSQIPRLILSPLLSALGKHLLMVDGLLVFAHDYLRKAVTRRYLYTDELKIQAWSEMADDWRIMDGMNAHKVIELPWLLERAERREDLAKLLSNIVFFEVFYKNWNEYELLHYWLVVRDFEDLESAYLRMLDDLGIDFNADLDVNIKQVNLVNWICIFLDQAGFFRSAIKPMTWVLKIREHQLGKDHHDTLISANNLALLLKDNEDYEHARSIFYQTLETRERILGNDHPDTLTSVNNLGVLLHETKDYDGAEILHRRALEASERILGKDHPNTIASINNLGSLLRTKKEFEEAEILLDRALKESERILGNDHPNTLMTANNLARLLGDQEDYEGAEILYRRTLESSESILGEDHPNTLTLINNLGILLYHKKDYEGAEILYRRVIDKSESILGKDHTKTLISVSNLADLLQDQEDYEGAEILYRRILETNERILGKDHDDTLNSANILGILLHHKKDYKGAEIQYRRVLEASEIILGKDHNDTLISVSNLAALLQDQEDYQEAEILHRRVLEVRERILGKDHPRTIDAVSNLGVNLHAQGQYQEAYIMLSKSLKVKEKHFYKTHPIMIEACYYLALLLLDMQSIQEAIPLLRRVFKSRNQEMVQTLLEKNPHTLKYALIIQKNDPSIVQIAVQQDPSTLQYASKRLQKQLNPYVD